MEYLNDLKLSAEIKSSRALFSAKPYSNGKVKVFFLPSVQFGREIVELIQRMDIEYENVTIDKISSLNIWGLGDMMGKRGGIGKFDPVYKNLEAVMTSDEHFDVLVLPGLAGWGHFSDKTRQAILKRVEQGTGLVLIKPFNGDGFDKVEELENLSPLIPLFTGGITDSEDRNPDLDKLLKDRWIPAKHYITSGIPFELFPYNEMGYFPYEAAGDVIITSESGKPVAAVKESGKGRIAAFGYYPRDILPQHNEFIGWDQCYEPIVANWHGPKHSLPFNYLEYFYSLITRSIIWAAKKEPESTIDGITEKDDTLYVNLSRSRDNLSLSYEIKDIYDNVVFTGTGDNSEIKIPEWLKLGGVYRTEICLKKGNTILDWNTKVLNYPLSSFVREICLDNDVLKYGDVLRVAVETTGTNGELSIQVVDDFENILFQQNHDMKSSNTFSLEYIIEAKKTMHIRIIALINIDGHLVNKVESPRVIITPQNRDFTDFEVFICPQNRGQGDLNELENKLLIESGDTGLYFGDNKLSALSGAEGLGINWLNGGPEYRVNKESYLKTKDKKYLHRLTCLNDEKYWEKAGKKIIETVKNNAKYGPVSYFANDEGSVTCYTDELDLCFCPICMNEMCEWLKEEYKDLDEMNQVWGTCYTDWSQAVPSTYLEAKKSGEFASWGDHKRFMELSFTSAYRRIRDNIREIDPKGKVRLSGTMLSTAYSGYDYYLLHQCIGYFECYTGGNQLEIHRSYANPGTVLGTWVGYGINGKSATYAVWQALFHQITLLSVFWEYSWLNPDFTYSKSAKDYGKLMREIKQEGIGKLFLYGVERDNLGIALHQSLPCIHGTYLKEDLKRYDDSRQGWINLLEDLGYQYDIIASQHIEIGKLIKKGYKLLILPYAIALSTKEVSEIKKFTENGGVVIGDFQTGIMDIHCKLYDEGSLDDLFGITRLTHDTQPFYCDMELTRTEDFKYFDNLYLYGSPDFEFAEAGIRVSTGKPAYVQDFTKTVPAVVVNEYGKGKGIYMNLRFDQYPVIRKSDGGGKDTRALVQRVLSVAGIVKPVILKNTEGNLVENGYETVYYNSGNSQYVAIVRDLGGTRRIGFDGLAIGNAVGINSYSETLNVKLQSQAHVYDIRKKKYFGFTDNITAEIDPGEVLLLSILPHKINSLNVNLPESIVRGETLHINIEVVCSEQSCNDMNAIAISFFNPAGNREWIYCDNEITHDGRLEKTYKVPFNEKTGKWLIRVKDVASGVSVDREINIL